MAEVVEEEGFSQHNTTNRGTTPPTGNRRVSFINKLHVRTERDGTGSGGPPSKATPSTTTNTTTSKRRKRALFINKEEVLKEAQKLVPQVFPDGLKMKSSEGLKYFGPSAKQHFYSQYQDLNKKRSLFHVNPNQALNAELLTSFNLVQNLHTHTNSNNSLYDKEAMKNVDDRFDVNANLPFYPHRQLDHSMMVDEKNGVKVNTRVLIREQGLDFTQGYKQMKLIPKPSYLPDETIQEDEDSSEEDMHEVGGEDDGYDESLEDLIHDNGINNSSGGGGGGGGDGRESEDHLTPMRQLPAHQHQYNGSSHSGRLGSSHGEGGNAEHGKSKADLRRPSNSSIFITSPHSFRRPSGGGAVDTPLPSTLPSTSPVRPSSVMTPLRNTPSKRLSFTRSMSRLDSTRKMGMGNKEGSKLPPLTRGTANQQAPLTSTGSLSSMGTTGPSITGSGVIQAINDAFELTLQRIHDDNPSPVLVAPVGGVGVNKPGVLALSPPGRSFSTILTDSAISTHSRGGVSHPDNGLNSPTETINSTMSASTSIISGRRKSDDNNNNSSSQDLLRSSLDNLQKGRSSIINTATMSSRALSSHISSLTSPMKSTLSSSNNNNSNNNNHMDDDSSSTGRSFINRQSSMREMRNPPRKASAANLMADNSRVGSMMMSQQRLSRADSQGGVNVGQVLHGNMNKIHHNNQSLMMDNNNNNNTTPRTTSSNGSNSISNNSITQTKVKGSSNSNSNSNNKKPFRNKKGDIISRENNNTTSTTIGENTITVNELATLYKKHKEEEAQESSLQTTSSPMRKKVRRTLLAKQQQQLNGEINNNYNNYNEEEEEDLTSSLGKSLNLICIEHRDEQNKNLMFKHLVGKRKSLFRYVMSKEVKGFHEIDYELTSKDAYEYSEIDTDLEIALWEESSSLSPSKFVIKDDIRKQVIANSSRTSTPQQGHRPSSKIKKRATSMNADDLPIVLSPRSQFIDSCIRNKLNPRASLILRKQFTRELNLKHLGMGDEMALLLAEALVQVPYITSVNICDNNLTDIGLSAIVNAIVSMHEVNYLNMSCNIIGPEAASSLANYLSSSTCGLHALILEKADVDDDECQRFVESLHENRSLWELDLSDNKVGSNENLNTVMPDIVTGGEALAELLRSPICTLKTLKLGWNLIRLGGAEDLCTSISLNESITYLDISFNSLGSNAGIALGDALQDNKVLKHLLIANNSLDSIACLTICAGILQNQNLETVNFDGNPIAQQGGKALMLLPTIVGSRVHVSARSCNISLNDSKNWFDTGMICRPYELDLSQPFHRAIALILTYLVPSHQTYIVARSEYLDTENPSTGYVDLALQEAVVENISNLDATQRKEIEGIQRVREVTKDVHKALALFQEVDKDGSGELDENEFTYLMETLGMDTSEGKVKEVMSEYDVDGGGIIELHEFLLFLRNQQRDAAKRMRELTEFPILISGLQYHLPPPSLLTVQISSTSTFSSSNPPSAGGMGTGLDGRVATPPASIVSVGRRGSAAGGGILRGRAGTANGINKNRPVYDKYTPPRHGILKLSIVDGFTQKESYRVISQGDRSNIMTIAKQSGDLLQMTSFGVQNYKMRYAEALGFVQIMSKENANLISILVTILPHMSSPQDARLLVNKVLNNNKVDINRLKREIGQAYKVIMGQPDGYYSLDLTQQMDRFCINRLLELSMTRAHLRSIQHSVLGYGKLGDTSQKGNWTSFRNELFNKRPVTMSVAFASPLPRTGRLEFDFISLQRVQKETAFILNDIRFTNLLVRSFLLDGKDRPKAVSMLKKIKRLTNQCLAGDGRTIYETPRDRAGEIGIHLNGFYNSLALRSDEVDRYRQKENVKVSWEYDPEVMHLTLSNYGEIYNIPGIFYSANSIENGKGESGSGKGGGLGNKTSRSGLRASILSKGDGKSITTRSVSSRGAPGKATPSFSSVSSKGGAGVVGSTGGVVAIGNSSSGNATIGSPKMKLLQAVNKVRIAGSFISTTSTVTTNSADPAVGTDAVPSVKSEQDGTTESNGGVAESSNVGGDNDGEQSEEASLDSSSVGIDGGGLVMEDSVANGGSRGGNGRGEADNYDNSSDDNSDDEDEEVEYIADNPNYVPPSRTSTANPSLATNSPRVPLAASFGGIGNGMGSGNNSARFPNSSAGGNRANLLNNLLSQGNLNNSAHHPVGGSALSSSRSLFNAVSSSHVLSPPSNSASQINISSSNIEEDGEGGYEGSDGFEIVDNSDVVPNQGIYENATAAFLQACYAKAVPPEHQPLSDAHQRYICLMASRNVPIPAKASKALEVLLDLFEYSYLYARHLEMLMIIMGELGGQSKLSEHFGTYRVELFVSLFSNIVDIHNIEIVLRRLTTFEVACIIGRVGILNLFNPMKPEGSYELDLSRRDDRIIVKILAQLSVVEPGDNLPFLSFRWEREMDCMPGYELTELWMTEDGLPNKGIWAATYYAGEGKNKGGCKPMVKFRKALLQLVLIDEEDLLPDNAQADDADSLTALNRQQLVGPAVIASNPGVWIGYLAYNESDFKAFKAQRSNQTAEGNARGKK